ncbi:hypothetical protein [Streptomyces sp. B21-083]|uniref:hypothetical protein n=1 Tax=Streptomyces sp. B21-083 TaxID=3039410 RepID=UPI002FEEBD8D
MGHVSEGTQANCTVYAAPGASTSPLTERPGSGRPLAASPAVWSAVPTFDESAAPCASGTPCLRRRPYSWRWRR